MVVVGVFLYFVAMTLTVGFISVPVLRARWLSQWARHLTTARNYGRNVARRIDEQFSMFLNWISRCFCSSIAEIGKHPRIATGIAVLALAPAAVAVAMQGTQQIDGFSEEIGPGNVVVSNLLQGEQLVPPPPLPPEVFVTRDVELVRPALGEASRDWHLLDEEFRQRLLQAFRLMEERHGYRMVLLEGYRSGERQAQLAAMGPQVTNAGAFQSYHQYGLAADCGFLHEGGLVISERDPWAMRGYQLFGEVAESLGLRWGGRWKLMDFGHVELSRRGVMSAASGRSD